MLNIKCLHPQRQILDPIAIYQSIIHSHKLEATEGCQMKAALSKQIIRRRVRVRSLIPGKWAHVPDTAGYNRIKSTRFRTEKV